MAAMAAAACGDTENFIIAAATPGGSEAQEKAGQNDQASSDTLPIKGTSWPSQRKQFKDAGFVFGKNADDLFVNVQFPKGWRKRPTDHSMWTDLIDGKGRRRGAIFYKAAFYDRDAHVSLNCRYGIDRYGGKFNDGEFHIYSITDCGKPVHTVGTWPQRNWARGNALDKEADAWLAENFPDYKNPSAYWD